jgi:hypothetical protein
VDDQLEQFRALTDDERSENFDTAVLKAVLQQLGWPAKRIRHNELEYGPAFKLEWLNDQHLLPMQVLAGRCFSYNLLDILFEPRKRSPLITFLADQIPEGADLFGLVFRCLGKRLIATNKEIDRPYLAVTVADTELRITTFNGFFKTHYGDLNDY